MATEPGIRRAKAVFGTVHICDPETGDGTYRRVRPGRSILEVRAIIGIHAMLAKTRRPIMPAMHRSTLGDVGHY